MIIVILPDNTVSVQGGETINSTHSHKASTPFIKAIADALVYKGAMEFADTEKMVFNSSTAEIIVGSVRFAPDSDVSGESGDLQAFHSAVYTHDGGFYADQYTLIQAQIPVVEDVVLTPEQEHQRKLDLIQAQFEQTVSSITSGYSDTEIKSWDQQKDEAERFTADSSAPTPMLDGIVAATGEDKAALVASITTKANLYADMFGKALGAKRAAEDAL